MRTFGLLAALALLGGRPTPASAAFISHHYDGMVIAVDKDAKKLSVTDHRGNVREFSIGDDVAIKKADSSAATFEDITSFDELTLTYKGKDRVTKVQIRPPRPTEERIGEAAPHGPP